MSWFDLVEAAKAARAPVRVSDFVEVGSVAAAVRSAAGNVYTGVCVDTCCTLGICAERNALFNMMTNGEYEIADLAIVMPDNSLGIPCGACAN